MKPESRGAKVTEMKSSYMKYREASNLTPSKIQKNPEHLFFESLRNIFDEAVYKIMIKLLHLFNEVTKSKSFKYNLRVF